MEASSLSLSLLKKEEKDKEYIFPPFPPSPSSISNRVLQQLSA